MVKYESFDVYWTKVGKMTRPTVERKYPALMKLAIIAVTLNHGNSDVARGFSKNKGCAMTKAEAANAIIQNARKALDDVQTAISNRDSKCKKKRTTKICTELELF